MYGETNLGATDEAVIVYLKTPMNKPMLDALKKHVYPEFAMQFESSNQPEVTTAVEEPSVNPPKKTSKK